MKVVQISGKKESGKNTTANYIAGRYLTLRGIIDNFNIREEGGMFIKLDDENICDLYLDQPFYPSTQQLMPYVHIYSWGYLMKMTIHQLFGVPLELMFGTAEDKNEETDIKWEWFKKFGFEGKGKMTVREVMETFGNMMRKVDPDIWVKAMIRRIKQEEPELAIIGDSRYGNEIVGVENLESDNVNVLTFRLLRNPQNSDNPSETALDKYKFDNVIDNTELDIYQTNLEVEKLVGPFLWPNGTIELEVKEEVESS